MGPTLYFVSKWWTSVRWTDVRLYGRWTDVQWTNAGGQVSGGQVSGGQVSGYRFAIVLRLLYVLCTSPALLALGPACYVINTVWLLQAKAINLWLYIAWIYAILTLIIPRML